MLNWVFLFLVGGAVITASFNGNMKVVTDASLASAKTAVELAIGLVGQMGVWLGFMRVLQDAGLMRSIANGLAPVMRRLFPEVPADHPAMGAMIMNMSANILGLGNAATPFGLKAMRELDTLNPHKGVATNAMTLFLAINTSGVAVLPLGVVAIRSTLGSKDPAGIVLPSLIATACNTIIAVLAVKWLERRSIYSVERQLVGTPVEAKETKEVAGLAQAEEIAKTVEKASPAMRAFLVLVWLGILAAMARSVTGSDAGAFEVVRQIFSDWLLPLLMLGILTFGLARRVKVYESFIAGAKESFNIAITIIPFLVAILVAIGMFRASGAMDWLVGGLGRITSLVGMPPEALPMAIIRPLSGSGALAVMTETMKTHGPDSLVGYIVSILNGASETTFYVLAVYFGSVGVRATRHTVAACLTSDIAGIAASVAVARVFFG